MKLTHQHHIHEIYAVAAPIYNKLKADPPTDPKLCPCINDVTGNGILEEMVRIAKQLKYFARQPRKASCGGTLTYSRTYTRSYSDGCTTNTYTTEDELIIYFRKKRDISNKTELINQLEEQYLKDSSKENAHQLMELQPWKPNTFTGPEQWVSYEAMLTWSMLSEEELNDFAMIMFCKLNQPSLDHTQDLFN